MKFTVWINGRWAVPVRALPFVSGWTLSPDAVVAQLAHRTPEEFACLEGLFAYQMIAGVPVPIQPKEWDAFVSRMDELERKIREQNPDSKKGYAIWRKESPLLLPAGVFLWVDEFELAFHAGFSPERIDFTAERPGDRALNFYPLTDRATDEAVREGFEVYGELTVMMLLLSGERAPQEMSPFVAVVGGWCGNGPPSDLIPFIEAVKSVGDAWGASSGELAMWIYQQDLVAWIPAQNRGMLRSVAAKDSVETVVQQMCTLGVCLSESDLKEFDPSIVGGAGRYLSYKAVVELIKAKIPAGAEQLAVVNAWEECAKYIKDVPGSADTLPGVVSLLPFKGYAERLQDGLFDEEQINLFLAQRIGKAAGGQTVPSCASRAAGRYTIEEAVDAIVSSEGLGNSTTLMQKLMSSVRSGVLPAFSPGCTERYRYGQEHPVREFHDEIYWDDLDNWLASNEPRIAFRFQTRGGHVEQPPRCSPALSRVHKLRINSLDPLIDKAIEQAGSDKAAVVFLALRELALGGAAPFTGAVDTSGLHYTDDDNKPAVLTKEAVRSRLKRRKSPGSAGR